MKIRKSQLDMHYSIVALLKLLNLVRLLVYYLVVFLKVKFLSGEKSVLKIVNELFQRAITSKSEF